MTNEPTNDNPPVSERATWATGPATARTAAPEKPSLPETTSELQDKFLEMETDTKHIVAQTDRIAAHLLDGPTGERRNAARSLLAQIEQISRNQTLLIHLAEQILARLPPAPIQGEAGKPQ